MMSRAPARASSTEATSPFTNLAASASGLRDLPFHRRSANGSSPFATATVARVFRLGRNGRYRSSRMLELTQPSIWLRSSGVSFPCSSMVPRMEAFRFSISVNTSVQCLISATSTSERPPVRSFRYRLMNGIVQPSAKSSAQFSTCQSFTCSKAATCLT